jgi:hypothetical protein
MEIFELYDSARGSPETRREMTDEEANLRNEDLREKQDSRRWIIYDSPGLLLPTLSRRVSKVVQEAHAGTLSRPHLSRSK